MVTNRSKDLDRYSNPTKGAHQLQKKGLMGKEMYTREANYLPTSLPKEEAVKSKKNSPLYPTTTELIMDPMPPILTKQDRKPRVIETKGKKKQKRIIVYLTSAGLLEETEEEKDQYANERRRLLGRGTSEMDRDSKGVDGKVRLLKQPLSLVNFQPFLAPFVPDLIRILVNSIEEYCYAHSWRAIAEPLDNHMNAARTIFLKLINVSYNPKATERIIQKMTFPVKILSVRLFLNELGTKPLHFGREMMCGLTKSPMFDFFLRPHPGLRKVVHHATLRSARGDVDTLAFLMIHLLHAWEFSDNPSVAKCHIASIYGRLLISFAEKPLLRGSDYGMGKTIESALLEVLLETCDCRFWNQLTMLKVKVAFNQTNKMQGRESQNDGKRSSEGEQIPSSSGHSADEETASVTELGGVFNMFDYSHNSSSRSGTTDTSTGVQSITLSTKQSPTMGQPLLQPKPKTTLSMSYISHTVPHILQMADMDIGARLRKATYRHSSTIRKAPQLPRATASLFRPTTEILRDIRRCRTAYNLQNQLTCPTRVDLVRDRGSSTWGLMR